MSHHHPPRTHSPTVRCPRLTLWRLLLLLGMLLRSRRGTTLRHHPRPALGRGHPSLLTDEHVHLLWGTSRC